MNTKNLIKFNLIAFVRDKIPFELIKGFYMIFRSFII